MNGNVFLPDDRAALLLLNLSATTDAPIDPHDPRTLEFLNACVRHIVVGTCVDAAAAGLLGVEWDPGTEDLVFTTDALALARIREAFADHGIEVAS